MLTSLIVLLLLQVSPAQDAKISVFISAPTRGGFVDTSKPIEDSINDIRKEMKGMKELRLVDDPAQADLLLIVAARGIGSEAFGMRTNVHEKLYTGVDVTTAPIYANTVWVSTTMQVGTYRKEFVGQDTASSDSIGPFWRLAAERVAKNVRAWAVTNAAAVRAKRKGT